MHMWQASDGGRADWGSRRPPCRGALGDHALPCHWWRGTHVAEDTLRLQTRHETVIKRLLAMLMIVRTFAYLTNSQQVAMRSDHRHSRKAW